jgi:hypothetical protein
VSRSRTSGSKVVGTNGVALTGQRAILEQLKLGFFLFQFKSIFPLKPTLSRNVLVSLLVFLKLRKKSCDSTDIRGDALLRSVVGRRHPSKRWPRGKEGEKIRGEFVGHDDNIRWPSERTSCCSSLNRQ